ncbi:ribosome biogenesis GTP-binding protein YihA/YsxC [Sulfuricurvum sp.]|uniref:ribosome biogenesis GTP-binding protein YihA/YsxC n=1 Tax=Sulfuricurvum sp. TaxID=2025608 RepID=UPI003C77AB45
MNKRNIVPEPSGAPQGADVQPPEQPLALVGAQFVIGAAGRSQLPPPGPPEIAFAGRSNAGKSSAINALATRTRLAFTSRTPGRTQQINLFQLRSGGLAADLPGYGYAAVARDVKREWQDFLWEYLTTRDTLVGLVLVADARHGLKPLDFTVLDVFVPSARPVLVLATKSDKLNQSEQRGAVVGIRAQLAARYPAQAHAIAVVGFSATRRIGVMAADRVLCDWLGITARK